MNSGSRGQGCGSTAYLKSTWQRTAVATPTKGTWGQCSEQTGTKYAQEMFQNTKELCYMSSERCLWTLAQRSLQKKQIWWVLYTNQKQTGKENTTLSTTTTTTQPQHQGMGLPPRGDGLRDRSAEEPCPGREVSQGNHLPGSPDPKSGWLRFSKRDAINPNPEGEGNVKEMNICWLYITRGAENTVLAASCISAHFVLITILMRGVTVSFCS